MAYCGLLVHDSQLRPNQTLVSYLNGLSLCSECRPEEYESGSTGGDCCDGEGREEVGEEEGGA